ncbi:hypothetical protein NPIL_522501, partial [Nephila pilipes]
RSEDFHAFQTIHISSRRKVKWNAQTRQTDAGEKLRDNVDTSILTAKLFSIF